MKANLTIEEAKVCTILEEIEDDDFFKLDSQLFLRIKSTNIHGREIYCYNFSKRIIAHLNPGLKVLKCDNVKINYEVVE